MPSRFLVHAEKPILRPRTAGRAVPRLTGGAIVDLGVNVPTQEETNWCWAATSKGIEDYYGSARHSQCEIAGLTLGADCCGNRVPCNIAYYLDSALTAVAHFANIAGVEPSSSVSREIGARRPLCARVGWAGGGGHFMAISGYDAATDSFLISDPIYGRQIVPRTVFTGAYQGSGSWTHTYYTK